jgi:hypothetical protein
MMAIRIASSPTPVDHVENRDNINVDVGGSIFSLAQATPKGGAGK